MMDMAKPVDETLTLSIFTISRFALTKVKKAQKSHDDVESDWHVIW